MMVSVLVSSEVNRMFEPRSGKTIDYKICMCNPSANNATLRSKNKDWLAWIRIMCPSEVTCLPANCSFSELALYFFKFHLSVLRSSTKGLSLSHINVTYSRHDMAKNALLLLQLKRKWDSSSTRVILWN